MLYGLYLSAQGADAQQLRIDVLSNNLAHASTTAFKRDFAFFRNHATFDELNGTGADVPEDQMLQSGGVTLGGIGTDFSTGPLQPTGSDFDFALAGPGFFRVLANGVPHLTRDGRFSLNQRGELVTADEGWPVLANGGQPVVMSTEGERLVVGADGQITQVNYDGSRGLLGRFDLVQPEFPEALQKVGRNLYVGGGEELPAGSEVEVKQRYIEGSGTNSVMEMVDLIQASREFETNINMIKLQDEALGRLLQSVPLRG